MSDFWTPLLRADILKSVMNTELRAIHRYLHSNWWQLSAKAKKLKTKEISIICVYRSSVQIEITFRLNLESFMLKLNSNGGVFVANKYSVLSLFRLAQMIFRLQFKCYTC